MHTEQGWENERKHKTALERQSQQLISFFLKVNWSLNCKSSKDLKALGRLVSQSFIVELALLLAFIINNLQISLSEILDFTF